MNNYKIPPEKEIKVKEYLKCYLSELRRHFDLPKNRMRLIVYEVYKDLSPVNVLKNFIKNKLSMVKSLYKNKIKRK